MSWKSICGATQGRGHKRKNLPCQDKVAQLEKNGVHIIALADGAGSAKFSHFGAECVINSVANFVADNFYNLLAENNGLKVKQQILNTALNALSGEMQMHGCELADLASTLLLAAADEDNFFLAHIGDGVIGYLNEGGLKVASTPDNGEFSNVTTFVTSKDAQAHMRIYKGALKKITAFILMSDGAEQSLYHKRTGTLAPVVVKLMHRTCLIAGNILTPQIADALNSVIAANTQDDCSLAILARPSEILPPINFLPISERQQLFKITGNFLTRRTRNKILLCDEICNFLKNPATLRQIARIFHLKILPLKKKLQTLLDAGVIVKVGSHYKIA